LGVVTNQARLRAIIDTPAFQRGELHTGFIDEHLAELEETPCPPPEAVAAAVAAIDASRRSAEPGTAVVHDPFERLGGLRLP
jgi:acetyl/propionyl-CoA carboxylase alpha subunit